VVILLPHATWTNLRDRLRSRKRPFGLEAVRPPRFVTVGSVRSVVGQMTKALAGNFARFPRLAGKTVDGAQMRAGHAEAGPLIASPSMVVTNAAVHALVRVGT